MNIFAPAQCLIGASDEVMQNVTNDEIGAIVINSTQDAEMFKRVADDLDLAAQVEVQLNEHKVFVASGYPTQVFFICFISPLD